MMKLGKLLCCVLLMLTIVSGCHGAQKREGFIMPEHFDESQTYEITFWAKNDTNKNQVAIYQKAIQDFETLYPNIKVNMRLYTDYSRIYNDVITNISTNTTPNVCITYPDHIATYLTGDEAVVKLNDLFTNEQYGLGGSEVKFDTVKQEEIVSQYKEEGYLADAYYAIPFMRSTEACYINKTYVEKLGYQVPDVLSWDFIWEVSETALAQDESGTYRVNGQKVLIPFIYKSTDNMMISMLKQQQAPYSNEDHEVLIFNDTTKEILYTIKQHTETGAFSTFKISSYPANFLNAGQCIFAIDSTAGATWMGSEAPLSDIATDAIVPFETVVRPIPQYDTERLQMMSQGPSICIFNKDNAQEVLASWLFAQYLLTDEVQVEYAKTEGYVPVTTKAQQSSAYQQYLADEGKDGDEHYAIKIQASKLLLAHIEDTFTTPVFNGSASLRDAAGEMIETVAKSIRRKKTVDDAFLQQLFTDMNRLYRLDQGTNQSLQNKDLGPLPMAAKALLGTLSVIWFGIILYVGLEKYKKKLHNK